MRILAFISLLVFSFGAYGQAFKNKKATVSAGGGTYSGGSFKNTVSVGDPGTATLSGGSFKIVGGFYPLVEPNEQPTLIELAGNTVDENEPGGASVGLFTTTDPNLVDFHEYTLVSGTGDTDNTSFQINGDEIQVSAPLNFENQETYSVRIRSTDYRGLFTESSFLITALNVNDTPDQLKIDDGVVFALDVDENLSVGQNLGTLSTVDQDDPANPDDWGIHIYSLPSGVLDNNSFTINGTTLETGVTFDFEGVKNTYDIRVRTTDGGGAFFEQDMVVNINDVNDDPTDITLSTSVDIPENQPNGTVVNTLTSTDEDAGETFTYTLVTGTGSDDNALFQISGNELQIFDSLNFERTEGSTFSYRLRTTDAGGLFYEEAFTVTVTDVDDPPRDVYLGNNEIVEGRDVGTAIGFFVVDDDDGFTDDHTFNLVPGTGSDDNALFQLNESTGEMKSGAVFNFNSKSEYITRIRATDVDDPLLFIEKVQMIQVLPEGSNAKPIDITLDNNEILELSASGSLVGTLTTNDPDPGDTHTYSLIPGDGDTDNTSFTITGDQLFTNTDLDFSTQSSYSIRIETDDGNAGRYEEIFLITVLEFVNSDPTDIAITANTMDETAATGTVVGVFSSTDVDPDESFTYSLVTGEGDSDNASFTIEGSDLKTNEDFDFLVQDTYSVRVQVEDANGGSYEEIITITILDTRDPIIATLTPATGSTDVDNSANLTMVFNEPVNAGTGNINILESTTDTNVESIDITSVAVTGLGTETITIDPSVTLDGGVQYYLTTDAAVLADEAGNPFAGISSKTDWSFTTIDDVAPIIAYQGDLVTNLTQGGSATIMAGVTDVSSVNVTFHYGGILTPMDQLQSIATSKEGDSYSVTVDDSFFDNIGLKYYFYAEDANGNSTKSDTRYMYLTLTTPENITGLKFGGKIDDYQIIAVPYILSNKDILNIFSEYGTYDNTQWRMVRYSTEKGKYEDFPAFSTLDIGKGYWFNAVEKKDIILAGRDKPAVTPTQGFQMQLKLGWNQIGNPFTVALNWDQVLDDNGITDEVESIWVYKGGGNLSVGTSLSPFEGGFVKATQLVTLNLFPGDATGLRKIEKTIMANDTDAEAWMLPLTLENGIISYKSGYFGMHPESKLYHDQYDLSRPPHLLDHMDYYFEVNDDQHTGNMVQTTDEFIYDLTVDTSIKPGFITLKWPSEKIGEQTDMILFDIDKQKPVDMKLFNQYGFYQDGKREFRIYYNVDPKSIIPDMTLLGSAYPNPFDRSTVIPFTLPENKNYQILLKVTDVLGKKINTLVEGTYQMGFHEVNWNGDNSAGKKAEAGIYVIQLMVNDGKKTEMYNSRVILQ